MSYSAQRYAHAMHIKQTGNVPFDIDIALANARRIKAKNDAAKRNVTIKEVEPTFVTRPVVARTSDGTIFTQKNLRRVDRFMRRMGRGVYTLIVE